jgi:hypothetical protein
VTSSRARFKRLHRLRGCGSCRAWKPDYDQYNDLDGVTVGAGDRESNRIQECSELQHQVLTHGVFKQDCPLVGTSDGGSV